MERMTAGAIVRKVVREPRFWVLVFVGLVGSFIVELLIDGAVGSLFSTLLFLGAVTGAGAMARAASGMPPTRRDG